MSTNSPSFAAECVAGSFTYVGETFDYSTAPVITVTARSYSAATGTDKEWLFYDWDDDSGHDDNATDRATFGIYAGDEVVIYTRELY